jgi:hypothetical protein
VELVAGALPFAVKLVEGMLSDVPKNKDLLFAANQAVTSYAYLTVQQNLDRARDSDFDAAERLRQRARRLYLRANAYGIAGLEAAHPGFQTKFRDDPAAAAAMFRKKEEVPRIYWAAASLGLAISSSRDDVSLIARIPEVDALLDRALVLDEGWNQGALHEFAIVLAAAKPGSLDYEKVTRHYMRALELSKGRSASLYVTYAESVSVPRQQRGDFEQMITRALAVVPGSAGDLNLTNAVAEQRAHWLMGRIDDLIISAGNEVVTGKEKP